MTPDQFTELLRLTRLVEFHHDKFVSPPRGCSSVLLWENMHALEIARAARQLRLLAQSILRDSAQVDASFALLATPAAAVGR
jgi:hypothetical protein